MSREGCTLAFGPSKSRASNRLMWDVTDDRNYALSAKNQSDLELEPETDEPGS